MIRFHRFRVNPRILVLASILLVITALMVIPAYVLRNQYHRLIIDEMRMRAEGLAVSVSALIEGELEIYRRLHEVRAIEELDDEELAEYLRLNATLHHIQTYAKADFIYTEKWIDSDTIAYVLDGTEPGTPLFSDLGDLDVMGVVERSVFLNRTVGSTDLIYVTNWGSYITGYAPIVDPQDDTVLGIVGVDYSANSVREHTRTMDLMIGASFFFLILLISIGIFIAFILMARASMEDYLTKLPSRRYFFRRLRDEIRTVKGGNRSFCLMLMDVDWFKMVNDTLGHTEGDRLLVNISGVIRKETRSIDSIARYGGDEFAVILPECSFSQGLTIARRIQHAVTLIDATPSRKASLSIGLAQWESEMDEMMLIECTDKALYQAKAAGKGKISVYDQSLERGS